mmetsp:Transcript_3440/g.5312  ORF Transcript_3440/g.5312 Transcript_3440/m.5312 type:complete len:350 (-) Transcript_3440:162-1211(-)
MSSSQDIVWEESTTDDDQQQHHPLDKSLANFRKVAFDAVENLALCAMSRMCRKGMGYDFPPNVTVDPRMKDAEYTIDKEHEVSRISEALSSIMEAVPEHSLRPVYLVEVHQIMEEAYKAFEEPRNGGPGSEAGVAHKCLESEWFQQFSEPTLFGLVSELEELWIDTIQQLEKNATSSSFQPPPPAHVLKKIFSFCPLIERLEKEMPECILAKLLDEYGRFGDPDIPLKERRLDALRESREDEPELTHKERLEKLQAAYPELYTDVKMKAFKKLIQKDNQDRRYEEIQEQRWNEEEIYDEQDEFGGDLEDLCGDGVYGFDEDDIQELLCQGVKPWDDDAVDVLAALHGDF